MRDSRPTAVWSSSTGAMARFGHPHAPLEPAELAVELGTELDDLVLAEMLHDA